MAKYEIMPGQICPEEDLVFRDVTGFIYLDTDNSGAYVSGTDTPIAGQLVILCLGPFIVDQVFTGVAGDYAFAPVPEGYPYVVKVNLNDFAPQVLPEFPIGADGVPNTGDHHTNWRAVGDTTGATFGDVCLTLKTDCGEAVQGAQVSLISGGSVVDTQTADAAGYAEFLQKPVGSYTVQIDTAGTVADSLFLNPQTGWDNVDQTIDFAITGTKTDLSEVFVTDAEVVIADVKVIGQPNTTYKVEGENKCPPWWLKTDDTGCAEFCYARPQALTIGGKTFNAQAYVNNEVPLP